jgi:hypothetical protein
METPKDYEHSFCVGCFPVRIPRESPVKRTLVWLIIGYASFSAGQTLPTHLGVSVTVERLLRFSGTLTAHRSFVGLVALNFTIYDEPSGGAANWQETQAVQPDAQGRYTVLLGANTVGGLPADTFAPGKAHWLGVGVSGQPEQPRILLVESPFALPPAIPASTMASARASQLHPAMDRYITLFLVILFLAGLVLTCLEVQKWWRKRMEQFRPPPLASLISYASGRDRLWRATQVLRFRLADLRAHSQHSVPSIDDSQPSK